MIFFPNLGEPIPPPLFIISFTFFYNVDTLIIRVFQHFHRCFFTSISGYYYKWNIIVSRLFNDHRNIYFIAPALIRKSVSEFAGFGGRGRGRIKSHLKNIGLINSGKTAADFIGPGPFFFFLIIRRGIRNGDNSNGHG